VRIANNSVYGLNGAVFGESEHALAIAKRMRTGQVDVNGGQFNPFAPFGGYKQSGNGREYGRPGHGGVSWRPSNPALNRLTRRVAPGPPRTDELAGLC